MCAPIPPRRVLLRRGGTSKLQRRGPLQVGAKLKTGDAAAHCHRRRVPHILGFVVMRHRKLKTVTAIENAASAAERGTFAPDELCDLARDLAHDNAPNWREEKRAAAKVREGEPDETWTSSELVAWAQHNGHQIPDPTNAETFTEPNMRFAKLFAAAVIKAREGHDDDDDDEHAAYNARPIAYVPPQPDIHNTSVSTSTLRKIDRAFKELQEANPGKRVKQVDVAKHIGVTPASVSKAKEVALAEAARLGIKPPAWAARPVVGAGRRRK